MPKKRKTTAKQKAAARKNLVKARKKWKSMSHKSRAKAMPRRKTTRKKTTKRKTTRKKKRR